MIKNILLSTILVSILSFTAKGQIFYQDIDPDVTISSWNVFDIHIDSLATASLSYGAAGNLSIWQEFNTHIAINAFSACEVVKQGSYPAALSLNDPINASQLWMSPSYSLLSNGSQGNWTGLNDHYLGVRINNGTHYLYGWIRLDVSLSGTSVTIKDYACNRTPDEMICAGQTIPTGTNSQNEAAQIYFAYPNPYDGGSIFFNQPLAGADIRLFDSFGKECSTWTAFQGRFLTMDGVNLPAGIYYFQISQGQKKGNTQCIKLIVTEHFN